MLMYGMPKYSNSYPMTSGSWWNYYRDEVNDDVNESNDADNNRIHNSKTEKINFHEYRTKNNR